MTDTGIILQARMGSVRFPGKILRPLGNKKLLLEQIVDRLSSLQHEADLVIATSTQLKDDETELFCKQRSIKCFRGSEEDVLSRYYECALYYGFKQIIRLTGDNPFVDVEELDNLIGLHLTENAEYSHSFNSLPVGTGAEIMTFSTLKRCFTEGANANHREHINEYIQENPSLFLIKTLAVKSEKNRPEVRLTVDTEDDYKRACFITDKSSSVNISTVEAISLLEKYNNTKRK